MSAQLGDPSQINELKKTIRERLKAQKSNWLTPIQPGEDAKRVEAAVKARSQAVDDALIELWKALDVSSAYALIAVGGYGRGELFPFSDVDVLVLLDGEPDATQTEKLQEFCGAGWDIGLEIGHSVRTVSECLEEAAKDITVETALSESRLLTGNKANYSNLLNQLGNLIDKKQFFRKKTLELRQRHAKYNETPYSLEPNCKESPGGLRDLHVISWVAKVAGLGKTWSDMAKKGLITPYEAAKLRKYERFLKKLRYQLHVVTGRREDRLVFDIQNQLASSFGFEATASRRASEFMMQQYYLAAKGVLQLNTILLQNIEDAIFQQPQEPESIDEEFQSIGTLLDIKQDDIYAKNPSALLRTFLVMQQNAKLKALSPRTMRAMWHHRIRINSHFRRLPENRQLFIKLFQQPQGIVHEFRRMNEMGILGRYLPPFRKIIGQMQHDLFHVYTVDQHIMTVVRNVRRFTMAEHAHEYPFCSQLIANFDDHWLLYIAALFHDIAKGRGGDHSELGAVEAAKFCKSHELSDEQANLIVFLVEHHLTMSTFAQKRDIADPDVVREFAGIVKTPRHLTALYLLTVADIRGTSPKVWNAWKGKLLESLYKQTLHYLGGNSLDKRQLLEEQQEEARRILRLYALSNDVQDKLWREFEVSYFLKQEPSEIAWHTRHLYWRVNTQEPVIKARLSSLGEGIEVLVYTRDEVDLFARISGYFDSKNIGILDAKLNTTKHGYALDSFLLAIDSTDREYRETLTRIEADLTDRLVRKLPLEEPVLGRISRQSKHFPIRPTVNLRPDDAGNQYLLTFTATDRTGLLYSVARLLAQYHINIRAAKIMTLGERVEDTLLINGESLNSQKLQIAMEAELLDLLSI